MVRDSLVPIAPQGTPARPSARQCNRRRRCRPLTLRNAVRRTVDHFFRFTQRNAHSHSLWCKTERVWLGRATFLNWAVSDPEINIPWVVAEAAGAPPAADDLLEAVRDELADYWAVQSAQLPASEKPRWLPLP